MILKSADDKTAQISSLESLLATAGPLKSRIKAESDAAYLIDFDLKDSTKTAVIHDLRIEANGRVAQIDHLLIHRTLNIFVLETKHFHAGLRITDTGEFLRWNQFKGCFEGMPSPLAQNERHITVLKDLISRMDMPTRLGIRLAPDFQSMVLVNSQARIDDRPKGFDTSNVIKADMLLPHIEKVIDAQNVLGSLAKFVSGETVEEIGRALVAMHRPATFDYAARFGGQVPAVVDQVVQAVVGEVAAIVAPSTESTPVCRSCGSAKLSIQYGKFGYYFKCGDCNGNTPIKISCGIDGHKERIRKDGRAFYRECAECKSSQVFFTNPA
jgi:hypothetical protein